MIAGCKLQKLIEGFLAVDQYFSKRTPSLFITYNFSAFSATWRIRRTGNLLIIDLARGRERWLRMGWRGVVGLLLFEE
jgi:hypothetical protein